MARSVHRDPRRLPAGRPLGGDGAGERRRIEGRAAGSSPALDGRRAVASTRWAGRRRELWSAWRRRGGVGPLLGFHSPTIARCADGTSAGRARPPIVATVASTWRAERALRRRPPGPADQMAASLVTARAAATSRAMCRRDKRAGPRPARGRPSTADAALRSMSSREAGFADRLSPMTAGVCSDDRRVASSTAGSISVRSRRCTSARRRRPSMRASRRSPMARAVTSVAS